MQEVTGKMYYEAFEKNGAWHWKIYRYDGSGEREIVLHRSQRDFGDGLEALDDCGEFMDEHEIDADLG